MEENLLYNIFLAYANTGNLYAVFDAVEDFNGSIYADMKQVVPPDLDRCRSCYLRAIPNEPTVVEGVLDAMGELIALGEPIVRFTKAMVEAGQLKQWWRKEKCFHLAYEAIYGYETTNCREECPLGELVSSEINWLNPFTGERIHCFECHHIAFRAALKRIVSNVPLENCIPESLIELPGRFSSKRRFIECGKLKEEMFFDHSWLVGDFRFNEYVDAIVGHSLLEFLKENDPRRLRYCNQCERFFIAERAGSIMQRSFCSPNCKDKYHAGRKMRTWHKNRFVYEATRAERERLDVH